MGIKVTWDNPEKNIILLTYKDPWTWNDYYKAAEKVEVMGQLVNYPIVGVISDFTQTRSIPANAVFHFTRSATAMSTAKHPALFVMVDAKGILQIINVTMCKLYPKAAEKVQCVGSLDTARAMLAKCQIATTS